MKIQIFGAHTIETDKDGCSGIIIDDILAIDAGSLTGKLSIAKQLRLQAVLLTHCHFDHIRDIPILAMNLKLLEKSIEIYTTQSVYETLETHLLNDVLYPNFIKNPPDKPALRINVIEPGKKISIAGYSVLPVSVHHIVPTVGYEITSADGKKVFFTSDTGPDLEDCWKQISPNLLLIEATLLNKDEEFAHKVGHLTPILLQKELESFRKIKSYLPKVVLVHMDPFIEKEFKTEISRVEKSLNIKIHFGDEGMKINI